MNQESNLQIACVNWFRLAHPNKLIYAIPNGGQRSAITAMFLKREGVVSGSPDLHIPIPSNGFASLYIEMKTPKGKLSDNQIEMGIKLVEFGNKVVVCRSIEQFIDEVEKYFRPLK
jgi:rhodanese-related sulfurtransferase